MPDLSILNTLIAMVIVILVLSLIVQSLQTFVKKFFKLKSRSIRNSLVDLFETITVSPDGTAAAGKGPNQLLDEVTGQLREMGRKTLFGRVMLDSLAKNDLLKVLTRVEANNLLPGSVEKFETVLGASPTADEKAACDAALAEWQRILKEQKHPDPTAKARADLVAALLNHNDFVTVR